MPQIFYHSITVQGSLTMDDTAFFGNIATGKNDTSHRFFDYYNFRHKKVAQATISTTTSWHLIIQVTQETLSSRAGGEGNPLDSDLDQVAGEEAIQPAPI